MKFRDLGLTPYTHACQMMQEFTQNRSHETEDEIWFCEHAPVYTLGRHSDPTHLLNPSAIPLEKTDRGGQITYHGPGQLMVYFLVDLKRARAGVAAFVCTIEAMVIEILKELNITAHRREGMHGVYVENKKICSIGLRVRNGRTYHGLALNVKMDLKPFYNINPCGYANLKMTQVAEYRQEVTPTDITSAIQQYIDISPMKVLLANRFSPKPPRQVCR